MTQFPHDEFAKNFLDSLLSPLGTVEVSQQISSEVRYADVYFTPQANVATTVDLGLLGNLKVILEARANIEPEEQELIMQLSPLYLEKIQAAELVGEQRGQVKGKTQGRVEEARGLVIRLLTRKVGNVSPALLEKIQASRIVR